MDRFILDLRDIPRESPSSLPLSYAGYLPSHAPNPNPIMHPTVDFIFALSAPGKLETSYLAAGTLLPPARAPYFLFSSPIEVYEAAISKDRKRELFYFAYSRSLLDRFEFFQSGFANRLFEIDVLRFAPFIDKAISLCQDIHAFGNVDRLDRVCEALALEVVLYRKSALASGSGTQGAVRAIASYIELHFRERIDFEELFRRHGVTKRSFLRHWGKLFKEPPGKYIERLKADEACRLLSEPGSSVGEVAARLGFSDPFYFSRFFRERKGIAPSAFKAAKAQK